MSMGIRERSLFWTRRHLLKTAGALTVGSAFAGIALAEPDDKERANKEPPLIQIGIFLEPFVGKTLEARLDAVKAAGLDCIQLSFDCAGLAPMPDEIAPDMLTRIAREAAARKIEIASLRGTFNMCHPDADYRRGGVRRIGVLAAACEKLGTPRIHLCTGTRDRINMWKYHPKNATPQAWQDMLACV